MENKIYSKIEALDKVDEVYKLINTIHYRLPGFHTYGKMDVNDINRIEDCLITIEEYFTKYENQVEEGLVGE